jgi:hypothetical protein
VITLDIAESVLTANATAVTALYSTMLSPVLVHSCLPLHVRSVLLFASTSTPKQPDNTPCGSFEPGTYIAFELDMARIKAEVPEDAYETQRLSHLSTGRFVGLVVSSKATEPFERVAVHLVAKIPVSHYHRYLALEGPSSGDPFPWSGQGLLTTGLMHIHVTGTARDELSQRWGVSKEELERFQAVAAADRTSPDLTKPTRWLQRRLERVDYCVPVTVWRDIRSSGASPERWKDYPEELVFEGEKIDRFVISTTII